LPAIASWLDQIAPIAQQEQSELAAAPDGSALTITFADVVTKLQAADAAAKGTDLAAFKAAFNDFSNAKNAFKSAARAANLRECSNTQ
jgi:hypothetical protein